MEEDLVSFIIPTYNRPVLLTRAINSVLKQTYKNIEIIVIDDNSPKSAKQLIKPMNNKKIKYYRNSENKGAPYSRNRGLKLAKGKFINFLDDDDEIFPQKVEKQLETYYKLKSDYQKTKYPLGIITCDTKYTFLDTPSIIRKNRKRGYLLKDLIYRYCVYGIGSLLILKDALTNVSFDENLPAGQEYDLMIQISRKFCFDFIPEVFFIAHESYNQISSNFRKRIQSNIYIFKKYSPIFKKFGMRFYLKMVLKSFFLISKYSLGILFGAQFLTIIFDSLQQILPSFIKKQYPNALSTSK